MNMEKYLNELGENSVTASNKIKSLTLDQKNSLLDSISKSILEDKSDILKANNKDIEAAEEKLSKSIYIALKKRPIDTDTVEKFITNVLFETFFCLKM